VVLAAGDEFAGYTIESVLGTGGMGAVYLAKHPRLPRRDALKLLNPAFSGDPNFRTRFEREADLASGLIHRNIVAVYDRGAVDGQLWISMQYVAGVDASVAARAGDGSMTPHRVVHIISEVGAGLDFAHRSGLLHRDVKPANILLANPESSDQRILLADFGIARWANDISGLTATNMTVGTVSYAAPEQLMGERLDGRADQYALAATAFHLLTGSPPFQHSNPAVVISQHLSKAPPAIGDQRPELAGLDPVLAKALAKSPADRFERCADFARALAHQLGGTPADDGTSLATPLPQQAAGRSLMRAGVIVPVILAVLLVAAVAVAVFETRRADDDRPAAATTSTSPPKPTITPLPPPPEPTTTSTPPTTTATDTPTATTTSAAPSAAVIGANCSPVGSTATTSDGSTAYCSTLQTTGASVWSLTQGDIPSPTVTTEPTEEPLPAAEESPVLVCMQQTGQTRRECRRDIRESNGLPVLP
jgi:serine/threonine protein kinase, bacterial